MVHPNDWHRAKHSNYRLTVDTQWRGQRPLDDYFETLEEALEAYTKAEERHESKEVSLARWSATKKAWCVITDVQAFLDLDRRSYPMASLKADIEELKEMVQELMERLG